MWRDFRYGWRLLRRSPGFIAVAVLTLSLGIGANTAMFSVLEAVLLRPPAYPNANRLVVVERYNPRRQKTSPQISAPDWKDYTERSRALESLSLYDSDVATLTGGEEAKSIPIAAISADLTATLGVAPILGRAFESGDGVPGSPFSVLISEALWRQRFAADPAVVGRSITLDGAAMRVVGVMPGSFAFPEADTAVWLPLRIEARMWQRRNVYWLRTVGRLKPGVSVGAARGELESIAARVAAEHPDTNTGQSVSVVSLQEHMTGNSRPILLVLAAAVGFVLLMVCTNLASLLLARATSRAAEFAVRAALGAARTQLLRQLLAEGILLGAIGGAGGMLLAVWGVEGLRLIATGQFSRAAEIRVDGPVLLFAMGASLLCGIVFGLAPAWTATRGTLIRSFTRATPRGASARAILVTAEVAMAFVLLAGAGLMTESLWRLQRVNPGFSADHVLTFHLSSRRGTGTFYEDLLAHIRSIPGVQAAGAVGNTPLSGNHAGTGVAVENRRFAPGETLDANYQLAGPGYFGAMGIPILAGRDFRREDVRGAPEVLVINHALANLCWPGQDAVGRHIRLGPNEKAPWATVVGVVGDVRHDGLDLPPGPEAYENYFQHSWGGVMTLMVRYDGIAASVPAAIRAQIRLADPDVAIPATLTLDDVIATSLRDRRFLMWMLAGFAAGAVLLAAIGIYGVVAYSVAQRTREIGIRVALGAERHDVRRLVLRDGVRMACAGVALGAVAALVVTRLLGTMLYHVRPGDPASMVAAAGVLVAAVLAGCVIPARRAARVEASVALRQE